jgi:phospholipase C
VGRLPRLSAGRQPTVAMGYWDAEDLPFYADLAQTFPLADPSPHKLKVGLGDLQFTSDLYPAGAWRCWRHLRHIDRFFDDCSESTLPAVSIVDPDFRSCSEEKPQNIQIGESFSAAVINAVMNSKGWPHTLVVTRPISYERRPNGRNLPS